MILVKNNIFYLNTKETSYIFRVADTGHLEHLHYGKCVEASGDVTAFAVKNLNLNGCAIAYDKEHTGICMNDMCLEVAGRGTGDMRTPSVELVWEDGSSTVDFIYDSYEILEGKNALETLPASYDETGTAKTLKVTLKEKYRPVKLELYYGVFPESDVITRSCILVNEGDAPVKVKRLMSAQLDILGTGYVMTTFHGDWGREMDRHDTVVSAGCMVNTSRTGFSANHANPFTMLFAPGSSENFGEGYACNLIYSGPHMEMVDVGSQFESRFLAGISPEQFSWTLGAGEKFETPEAVLTFSDSGYSKISEHMHRFVREHVVRGEWKYKERPVLLNSWEAAYFNITEKSLLKLAKVGKEAGIELFVMDDGWFGNRKDDFRSLGDWDVNLKKLPNGVGGLAKKVNDLGLMFGIWVEPEMVNEDSNLYRAHPDWAVKIPGRAHGEGRNQMLLDLTRAEVQDFIIDAMKKVFSSGNISYVKWDMNRNFSDVYSTALAADRQEEFLHRYIMGLYRILSELVKGFPQILFESCASGGNRFDLGMLCYMPQTWASDDSDAIARCYIQNGLSYGYPQSTIGAHVSNCPNHQTLRNTPLETRFAVASMGSLGYECNLSEMKPEEVAEIKQQIAIYKKWRKTLQYGQLYRIGGKLTGNTGKIGMQDDRNLIEWNIVSEDKSEAAVIMVQETVKPHTSQVTIRTKGLDDEAKYHFYNRVLPVDVMRFGDLINILSPVHIKKDSLLHKAVAKFYKMKGDKEDRIVSGSVLNHVGYAVNPSFAGTGMNEGTRVYQDFDARMYFMKKEK